MTDLSAGELAWCIAVLLATYTLRGSVGFGGAIGMPLLALVLPVKMLAPAWTLIGIVSSLAILGKDRRYVDRGAFLSLLPGCALGVLAGVFLFDALDATLLARALGVFVILYAGYTFWLSGRPVGSAPPVPRALIRPAASFLSGAVGTLFGAMASIFLGMFLDASGANRHAMRATLSAMLIVLSLMRTVAYAAVGELTLDAFILVGAALPAMALGLVVGERLLSGLSETGFQRLIAATFLACGVALLLK